MLKKRKILFFTLLSILIISLQIQSSVLDKATVKKTVLENGLTIITNELHNLPVVTLDIWVKMGSINEDDEDSGISHFLEHMLFKGTEERGVGEIDKAIEGIGGRLNAGTSMDFTHYYATIPQEYLDLALDVMCDMIKNPKLDPREIEKEKNVVIEEIRRKEDIPEDFLSDLFRKVAYKIHPYARSVLGGEQTLRKITKEELRKYHNVYYVPNNIAIILVGDFKTEDVIKKIQDIFKDEKKKPLPLKEYQQEPKQVEKRVFIIDRDIEQAYLALGFHAPSVKDIPDVYAMDLILTLLGEGKSSRLYKRLKEKKGLVQKISCDFLTQKEPGLFIIIAVLDSKNIDSVEKEIIDEIEELKKKGVSEKELNKAKTLLKTMVIFDAETTSGKSSYLGFYETIDTVDFALTYLEEVEKTTPKQIKKVANKYFGKDSYVLCILRPKEKRK